MLSVIKKLICIILIVTMLPISGCMFVNDADGESPYEYSIVVDVYDSEATFDGLQSGWFAKVVRNKFNMELNIITPSDSPDLYDSRVAAGNLGDLIICDTTDGKLQSLVDSNLLYDMTDLIKDRDIMQYSEAIYALNNSLSQTGIYAIPSEVSKNSEATSNKMLAPDSAPYLRWDIYALAGYPDINAADDIVSALTKMKDTYSKTEDGTKTYGFSLCKDLDNNMMYEALKMAQFYGYSDNGYVLSQADGSNYQDILADGSIYIAMLRILNIANRNGLVDPESTNQNYETLYSKYQNGSVLFCSDPWLCTSAYNTIQNEDKGKGYMLAPVKNMSVYMDGYNKYGNQDVVIAIGKNADDPERLVDFIDWLYSPEGIRIQCAKSSGSTAGPEGLTWKMGTDGPHLTDFGVSVLLDGDADVSSNWGDGSFDNGVSALNYKPVSETELDDSGYYYYYYDLWDSVQDYDDTVLETSWKNYMLSDSIMDYLNDNNMVSTAADCKYLITDETTELITIRTQCSKIICDYSWKMIYAQSNSEFNQLLNELKVTAESLGYSQAVEYDMQNARLQAESQ